MFDADDHSVMVRTSFFPADPVPGSSGVIAFGSQQRPSSSGSPSGTRTGPVQVQVPAQLGLTTSSRPTPPAGSATQNAQTRLEVQHGRSDIQNIRLDLAMARPQPPLAFPSSVLRPDPAPVPADSLPTPAPPRTSERGSRPGPEPPGPERRPAANPTNRPTRVQRE